VFWCNWKKRFVVVFWCFDATWRRNLIVVEFWWAPGRRNFLWFSSVFV
jgi:hypothetical protein